MRATGSLVALLGFTLAIGSAGMARHASGNLPDPAKTPGDTLNVTKEDICTPGYSKKVRNVPVAVKNQVYAEYGITHHAPGEYEIDHLISLELGGSNSLKNLWPQSYKTQPWNAHVKDKLENKLHQLVCSGQVDMRAAQQAIAHNWIDAYKKYMNVPVRGGHTGRSHRQAAGKSAKVKDSKTQSAGKGNVWVNTASGKYFRPGSRYYGKTKQGKYMSESEARKQGFKAAKE